jgi:hypothetical protein
MRTPRSAPPLPSLLLALGLSLGLTPLPTAAQEVRWLGEFRPRYEQRDPAIPAPPAGDVVLRARLGAAFTLPDSVRVVVVFQDTPAWGGNGAAPALSPDPDLFVAFAEFGALFGSDARLRVGRQEIALSNERLVSRNNWNARGQRFDGLRLFLNPGARPVEFFSLRTAERGGSTVGTDAWLHGTYLPLAGPSGALLHLYGIYDRARGNGDTDQFTAGGHTQIEGAGVRWTVEGYAQTGTRLGKDVAAYFLSAGAGKTLGQVDAQVVYDHYSGNGKDAQRLGVFDRLRGANHLFHGYADLFTQIATHTAGQGLGDLSVRGTLPLRPETTLQARGHLFRATRSGALPSPRFGEEVDLVVTHRARTGVALEAGVSRVFAGPGLAAVRGLERDLTFGYAMLTVSW